MQFLWAEKMLRKIVLVVTKKKSGGMATLFFCSLTDPISKTLVKGMAAIHTLKNCAYGAP